MTLEELNTRLYSDKNRINTLMGFEIICEAMVYKVLDLFGKNALLSMLFQIGAGPGDQISQRLKIIHNRTQFEPLEAFELLVRELANYYSIQVREIQEDPEKIRLVIENHCFLRNSIKNRTKLQYGKAFCRVNKGYFETALRKMVGNNVSKIQIKFLYNDHKKDSCIEELVFFK